MGFVELKCPSCGASINLDSDKEFGFCSYCGAKIMQDKIVVEHKGKVSIDGITSENALLDRAFLFVEDGKFDQASEYFERVLDINPRCSSAYLGKLLCQLKYRSTSVLVDNVEKPLNNYENFKKAKRFASTEEKANIEALEREVLNRIEGIEKAYQANIDASYQRIQEQNDYLDKNKNEQIKRVAKGTGLTVLSVVLVILSIIITAIIIVAISDPETRFMGMVFLFLICFPLYIGSFFAIKKQRKNKKNITQYKEAKQKLSDESKNLNAGLESFEAWKNDQRKAVGDEEKNRTNEKEITISKPLNNVILDRTKPHMFGNSPIVIYIDNTAYAQAPKSGIVNLNLSQGTHTMCFKSGKLSSDVIPISINELNVYRINYELGYLSIKTSVSAEYAAQ